jgi:hypothetical protein
MRCGSRCFLNLVYVLLTLGDKVNTLVLRRDNSVSDMSEANFVRKASSLLRTFQSGESNLNSPTRPSGLAQFGQPA